MKIKSQKNNPKVHITKSATDAVFENCEFIGVDLQNDGKRTKVLKTGFYNNFFNFIQNKWHLTWWGVLILSVVSGVLVALIT